MPSLLGGGLNSGSAHDNVSHCGFNIDVFYAFGVRQTCNKMRIAEALSKLALAMKVYLLAPSLEISLSASSCTSVRDRVTCLSEGGVCVSLPLRLALSNSISHRIRYTNFRRSRKFFRSQAYTRGSLDERVGFGRQRDFSRHVHLGFFSIDSTSDLAQWELYLLCTHMESFAT